MAMNQVQFQSGLSMAATRATIAPRHDPLRPLRRAEPASGDQLSWLRISANQVWSCSRQPIEDFSACFAC